MPQVLRNLKYESDRNTRNFRIFKDYLQALEYLMNGFHYFSSTDYYRPKPVADTAIN